VQSELAKYALEYRNMLRHVDDLLDTKVMTDAMNQIKEYLGTICIYSTCQAFAALMHNGRVVTWGSPQYGGNSSRVQPPLTALSDPGHGGRGRGRGRGRGGVRRRVVHRVNNTTRETQVTFKKAPPDDTLVKINDKIGRLRRLDPTTVVKLNQIKRVKVE
jgi:hypothetical protein